MTVLLLLTRLLASGADPRGVVSGYLDALRNLDQKRMAAYCAPDLVWVGADGSERKPADDRAARDMRGFEREMRTVWTYRVLAVEGGRVSAELSERSDFYELLGVGRRTQQEVYVVREGLIRRMETRDVLHARGDYKTAYARFQQWLLNTPAASDSCVLRDGALVFDAKSARRLRPWLEKWSRERGRGAAAHADPPP